MPRFCVTQWNDAKERKFADVKNILQIAIDKVENGVYDDSKSEG